MSPVIDHGSPVPAYVQIADHLNGEITGGRITGRLPSERALMATYGVARMTVRQALAELQRRGLIVTTPGRGSFVAPPEP
jgi:DNA-binding GntR family transcriptional regulator